MMHSAKYLVDAHRPAQADADASGLPQTVFYNPDLGFSNTVHGSRFLRDRKSEQHVTWLPSRYFDK